MKIDINNNDKNMIKEDKDMFSLEEIVSLIIQYKTLKKLCKYNHICIETDNKRLFGTH